MAGKPPKPEDRPRTPRFKGAKSPKAQTKAKPWLDVKAEFALLRQARDAHGWHFENSSLSDTEVALSAASVLDEYLKFSIVVKLANIERKSHSDRLLEGPARWRLSTQGSG